MKRSLFCAGILLALVLLAAGPAAAEDGIIASGECGENLIWILDADGTLTVSGEGDIPDFHAATQPWYEYRLFVRKAVVEEGVTRIGGLTFGDCTEMVSVSIPQSAVSIGTHVFWLCDSLKSVTIPAGVARIKWDTFDGCRNLEEINVEEGNGYFTSADGVLFNREMTELAAFPCGKAGEYTVPDGVLSINTGAFYGCIKVTGVVLPEGAVSVADHAFFGCTGLVGVTLPDSITSIGYDAFSYCLSLKSVKIPRGVTSLEMEVFYFCDSLSEVTIPEGVVSIRHEAFGCCRSLQSITLPDSLREIGDSAFMACDKLTEIRIPEGVTEIETNAFRECGELAEVTIPQSVTAIGGWAFYKCEKLKDIRYPGTEEQWSRISVGTGNDPLLAAEVLYESASPAGGWEREELDSHFGNRAAIGFLTDDGWTDAELLPAPEGGLPYDKKLLPMSALVSLMGYNAPVITAGEEPRYRITCDVDTEITGSRATYWGFGDEGLELLTDDRDEPLVFSDLPDGVWLMIVEVNGRSGDTETIGMAVAWVIK